VVGVTTNPAIFAKAIAGSDAYANQMRDLWARGAVVGEALRGMTAFDVRWACDVLRPVYGATSGVDGRVSIEVDPRLAYHTEATIAEARFLWWLVDRPNLLVKIPAARQGLPAITACLAEGISINVTLIFSLVADSVRGHYAEARQVLRDLEAVGVDYGDVTEGLESNGLAAFDASWRDLGDQIAARLRHPEEGRTTREENRA